MVSWLVVKSVSMSVSRCRHLSNADGLSRPVLSCALAVLRRLLLLVARELAPEERNVGVPSRGVGVEWCNIKAARGNRAGGQGGWVADT